MFYAHSNGPNKSEWQALQDHLNNTASIAFELCKGTNFQEYATLAAMMHDLGKYSLAFQRRLEGAAIRVDHSTAGAQEIFKLFNNDPKQRIQALIIAYCIAGHHGGLPDYGSPLDIDSEGTLRGKLKRNLEDYSNFQQELEATRFQIPDFIPIKPVANRIGFSLSFFTRMVYSALVDADFLETEAFVSPGQKQRGNYPDIPTLCRKFNEYLTRFEHPQNPVDRQRTETLKQCIAKANEKPGLFSLTVPTGGGKTLASMAFALNHAVANGQKRIIYVIPYTSIIEQNAAVFKQALGEENVLEHHSNFDWNPASESKELPDNWTNNTANKLKLSAENWDIPIIVTTNVQFFESLFADRSSRSRKVHNIANSIVIFDEAQMLPREYLEPCMAGVYELVKNYGVTAVFCTATQPKLERFLPEGAVPQELVDSPQTLFNFYRRVEVKHLGKTSDEGILELMCENLQALCIVNTRRHAKGLFGSLPEEGRFHLSTLMCPMHRREVLSEIKARLKDGLPCRVVSTQIMEAGIDVDFPIGFRSLAGLDSIVQAGGRVNREGKRNAGKLLVFEPDSIFIKRTPAYIQQGAEVALDILRKFDDPVCVEAIEIYFSQLYSYHDPKAFDAFDILNCFQWNQNEPIFNFATAARNFNLIQNNTKTVIIRYDEQVDALLSNFNLHPYEISRKLQPYSVNIYENEFMALMANGLVETIGKHEVLRDMSLYNPQTGLEIPESGGAAIFFDG